jgi:hypothetical protein
MFITFTRFYSVASHKSIALIHLGVAIPLRFYEIKLISRSKQHNFKNVSKGVLPNSSLYAAVYQLPDDGQKNRPKHVAV